MYESRVRAAAQQRRPLVTTRYVEALPLASMSSMSHRQRLRRRWQELSTPLPPTRRAIDSVSSAGLTGAT